MTARSIRIVIIGRTGQVGRYLWDTLRAGGHDVIRLGRPEIDLEDPSTVTEAILGLRPEIVINSAAYTAVDKAEDEPLTAGAINVAGAEAIAKAATAVGAPIIHFSTDYVFDGQKGSPYRETDAVAPIGVYGRTKLAGEIRVARANPRHLVLRTAWICSPFGKNFVKTILRLAAEHPELRVVDDQRGNPTFAADLADVVAKLLPRIAEAPEGSQLFGLFHAVNQGDTTWYQFADAIMRGAACRGARHVPVRPITTEEYPTRVRRPAYSVLSTQKLDAVYGVHMRNWEVALSACLDQLIGPENDKPPPRVGAPVGDTE